MTTATKANPAKAAKTEYADPLALRAKPDEVIDLPLKVIETFADLQVRTTIDGGSDAFVDEGRAEGIAAVFRSGDKDRIAKIDPVKVVRVEPETAGGKPQYLLFDGYHTRRGGYLAKVETLKAKVWNGTRAQAMHAAATMANREHEANGAPLTSKDKIRSVKLLAASFLKSDIPKKEYPSYRWMAARCGCSHQLVNNMDPFHRGRGDTRAEKAAVEKSKRHEANGTHANGTPAGVGGGVAVLDPVKKTASRFAVTNAAGQPIAHYDEATAEKAEARFAKEHPDHAGKVAVVALPAPAKAGSPAGPTGGVFDWAEMDARIGYIARGMTVMSDTFDLKKSDDFAGARKALTDFADFFKKLRDKHGKRK